MKINTKSVLLSVLLLIPALFVPIMFADFDNREGMPDNWREMQDGWNYMIFVIYSIAYSLVLIVITAFYLWYQKMREVKFLIIILLLFNMIYWILFSINAR